MHALLYQKDNQSIYNSFEVPVPLKPFTCTYIAYFCSVLELSLHVLVTFYFVKLDVIIIVSLNGKFTTF